MKTKKPIFLFLALLLPICIFLFLKFFGRNEFAVEPLYVSSFPELPSGCANVKLPYAISDTVKNQLLAEGDSLVILIFATKSTSSSSDQVRRLKQEMVQLPVRLLTLEPSERHLSWKNCVFFLKDPFDIAMVDRQGRLRGNYASADREDVDRLLTEVTIILKRY